MHYTALNSYCTLADNTIANVYMKEDSVVTESDCYLPMMTSLHSYFPRRSKEVENRSLGKHSHVQHSEE